MGGSTIHPVLSLFAFELMSFLVFSGWIAEFNPLKVAGDLRTAQF